MGQTQTKEEILDGMFGNKNNIMNMIRQEQWEKAASFGDYVCYQAVTTDQDWIWTQADHFNCQDPRMNSTSYGNLGMMIHYGSKYPHRAGAVDQLKTACKNI